MRSEFERTSKELDKKVQDTVLTPPISLSFTPIMTKLWGGVAKATTPKLSEQSKVPSYGTFENKS